MGEISLCRFTQSTGTCKGSVKALALPNETEQRGFPKHPSLCERPVCVYAHAQEANPTEKHVLLYRLQSCGRDPTWQV